MKLSDESRDLKSETQPSRLIGRVEIETISQAYSRPEVGRVIVLKIQGSGGSCLRLL